MKDTKQEDGIHQMNKNGRPSWCFDSGRTHYYVTLSRHSKKSGNRNYFVTIMRSKQGEKQSDSIIIWENAVPKLSKILQNIVAEGLCMPEAECEIVDNGQIRHDKNNPSKSLSKQKSDFCLQ